MARIKLFLIFTAFILPISNFVCLAQSSNKSAAIKYLDSVKVYYGDTCHIGVSSRLIKGLKKYSKIPAVAEYLKQYEEIRNRINSFRGQSISNIYNNAAILLEMDRIFKDVKNRNIINACGFYYGPDSVSSLIVSYSIVRNSVKSFYINILQMANFDRTFKKEIEKSGKDWYYSAKLHEVKDVPFKTVLARAPNK